MKKHFLVLALTAALVSSILIRVFAATGTSGSNSSQKA